MIPCQAGLRSDSPELSDDARTQSPAANCCNIMHSFFLSYTMCHPTIVISGCGFNISFYMVSAIV